MGNIDKSHNREMSPKFQVANFLENKRELLSNIQGQYLERLYKPNKNHKEKKKDFDIYLLHFLYLIREYLVLEDPKITENGNKLSIYTEVPIVEGTIDGREWRGLKSIEERMESADIKLKGSKNETGSRKRITVSGKPPALHHQVAMNAYKYEMIAYNRLGFSKLSRTSVKEKGY